MSKRNLRPLEKAYVYLTTALAFVATVAPAIIRADVEPAAGVGSTSAPGSTLLQAPLSSPAQTSLFLKVTAYSSSPDETDSTPFITANGTRVHDGVAATNLLPFGTKVTIPELFGDKVFTVEDRMAERMKNVIDIWMPSKAAALRFGMAHASVVIISTPPREISKR